MGQLKTYNGITDANLKTLNGLANASIATWNGLGVSATTDPYWANVVLLALQNNGSDGSTTFTDQSSVGHTLTAAGNAQWDTAQAPTGLTSSLLCDGTGDWVSAADSDSWNFGSGDFTVEGWVRWASAPGSQGIICQGNLQTGGESWFLWTDGSNLRCSYTTSGGAGTFRGITGAWTIATNTWYHVAMSRNGANFRGFVDGTQVGSTFNASTDTIYNSTVQMRLGSSSYDSAWHLNGWLGGARITKGVARYTANFTPPTLPMPTS